MDYKTGLTAKQLQRYNAIKSITDSLPTGYYLNTRIPVEITLNSFYDNAVFNPATQSISIPFSALERKLSKVPTNEITEELIRPLIYHEVTHSFMTPYNLRNDKPIQIFEDERIETLTDGFYLNTDFEIPKNKFTPPIATPTTPLDAFFNAVRHGICPKEITDKISNIIKRYSDISDRLINDGYGRGNRDSNRNVPSYQAEILKLYNEITKMFKENPDDFKDNSGSGSSSKGGSNDKYGDNFSKEKSNNDDSKDSSESDGSGSDENGENGDGEKGGDGGDEKEEKNGDKPNSAKSISSQNAHGRSKFALSKEQIQNQIGNVIVDLTKDEKLTARLSAIIDNFNKKNNGGSGITGYSGVLNPRNVARKDYRYFDRKSSMQGSNQFGTMHLNLFIDVSGSFSPNTARTNTLLHSLEEIEKKNPNFSFDLITMQVGQKIADKSNRRIRCSGGNNVTEEIFDQFRTMQKPQTYNYNIVLFDGDAYSDCYSRGSVGHTMKAFDTSNTIIISDYDNQRYLEPLTSARVILTKNYCDKFSAEVEKAIAQGFH